MDMQFYGANCIALTGKQIRLVFDDNLASVGGKTVTKNSDIVLFTHSPEDQPDTASAGSAARPDAKMTIDMPGEYEVSGVSVFGLQARAHLDEPDARTAVVYKVTWGDTRVLVTGHIFPKLTDDQLESIGIVDVMFVPVGGHGYTLDAGGALQLIKAVEPKIVIPTHYEDANLRFEVPQAGLEEALKNMAMEPKERVSKYQFKAADMTDTTQLVVVDTTR